MSTHADVAIPLTRRPGASLRERLVDVLAEVLLDTDDALAILDEPGSADFRWIESHLRTVFEEVNDVMRKLTD